MKSYISLLIIPCMIVYVTNKQTNNKQKNLEFKKAHSASPWQDMKQHTKYNDPVRNYGALSSFYQMVIITSIHFTILPLAFYLD